MNRISAQVILACALIFLTSASFAVSLEQAEQIATTKKIWNEPYWIKLVHYEKRTFGGYRSQSPAKSFFLSAEGRDHPDVELMEDLKNLFDTTKKFENPNDHPACRFPLRYTWLREKLDLDAPPQEELNCPDFKDWLVGLGANGASLIFASSYTNNPASMFGHTFLRLHRVKNNIEIPSMLHYSVNFAAETGTEKGMMYTLKGLFGFYPGYFSTFPYYIKIQQYNNFESRDLWEYDLNLSKENVKRIVYHLWEMGSTYFPYYFADENCSYFLLALLEVADEKTELLQHLPFFTIPVDTLKVVDQDTDWIAKTTFRASLRRRYDASYRILNSTERKLFDRLVEKQNAEIIANQEIISQAKILDAAMDFFAMKEKQSAKTPFQKDLIQRRSAITATYEKGEIDQPSDPVHSHPAVRMGVGATQLGDETWAQLDFRGAYHDLLDDPRGFDPLAQIQVLDSRIRFSTERKKITLDHVKAIEILSLNPLKKYLYKPSWNVGFGWRQQYSDECFDCGTLYLEGGAGLTAGNSYHRRLYVTMFANLFVHIAPWYQTNYQVGPSGVLMINSDITDWFRIALVGNAKYSPFGSPNFNYDGRAEGVFEISKAWNLRGWYDLYSESHEYGGTFLYYF